MKCFLFVKSVNVGASILMNTCVAMKCGGYMYLISPMILWLLVMFGFEPSQDHFLGKRTLSTFSDLITCWSQETDMKMKWPISFCPDGNNSKSEISLDLTQIVLDINVAICWGHYKSSHTYEMDLLWNSSQWG